MALKDGVLQAKPALLEPIMAVEVKVLEQYMGEVNRDLNGRRGRVLGLTRERMRSSRPRCPRRSCLVRDRARSRPGRGVQLDLDHYDVPSHSATRSWTRTRRTTARATD
jgi:elongation factor G